MAPQQFCVVMFMGVSFCGVFTLQRIGLDPLRRRRKRLTHIGRFLTCMAHPPGTSEMKQEKALCTFYKGVVRRQEKPIVGMINV